MSGMEQQSFPQLDREALPELSEVQTQAPRAARSPFMSALAGITLTTGLFGTATLFHGCVAPPVTDFKVDPIVKAELGLSSAGCIESLERVEAQLATIEQIRAEHMVILWPFLQLNASFKERYEQGVEHHRCLAQTACDYKRELVLGGCACSGEKIEEARAWATQTEQDLNAIFVLIDYVKAHHGFLPHDWKAPKGFEYIRPL